MDKFIAAGGAIEAIFFQQVGDDPAQTTQAREAQIASVADTVATFIHGAAATLDLAIYDFRLADAAADRVKVALQDRAAHGVAIRILYDITAAGGEGHEPGNDMAPAGTAEFLASLNSVGEIKGVTGVQSGRLRKRALMHNKYITRDAKTPAAATMTGSTNFTNDSWGLQENNIYTLRSPDLAVYYRADFDDIWKAGEILPSSGFRDTGTVSLGGVPVTVAFAPGEGQSIVREIVQAIDAAEKRIFVASMVLSSGPILAALSEAIDRGVTIEGVCDATQMDSVVAQWRRDGVGEDKINTWEKVRAYLSGKASTPYTPDSPHDFLHIKTLVADNTVATGSFNFSNSARGNAENIVVIRDDTLADGVCSYIRGLAARYRQPRAGGINE